MISQCTVRAAGQILNSFGLNSSGVGMRRNLISNIEQRNAICRSINHLLANLALRCEVGERYFGFGSYCEQVNFKNFATACRRQPAGHWIKMLKKLPRLIDFLYPVTSVYRLCQSKKNCIFHAITYTLKVGACSLYYEIMYMRRGNSLCCGLDPFTSEIINSFFSVATFAFLRHTRRLCDFLSDPHIILTEF